MCFICHEYPPASHGGIGTVTQTLARGLTEADMKATVVGVYPIDRYQEENDSEVKVLRIPRSKVSKWRAWSDSRRLQRTILELNRHHPIHILEGKEDTFGLLRPSIPAPRVIRLHGGHRFFSHALGTPISMTKAWLESRSLRRAHALCAVSRYVAAETTRLAGLHEHRIPNTTKPGGHRTVSTTDS